MELTRIPSTILLYLFSIRREKLRWLSYLCTFFILINYFSTIVAQPREQQSCPQKCRCLHNEGRLTADCSGSRLQSIPGPLPSGAMIVRFDNNPVYDSKWLQQSEYFFKTDRYAVDWSELSLSGCNISGFRAELFWGLTNLNKLILSRNKLTRIPTKPDPPVDGQDTFSPFRDMTKLRVLDLSQNQLTIIVKKNFDGAVNLEEIDLSQNEIKFLNNDAFFGLPKLRTIDLTKNKLALVNRLTFSRLPHLKQLQLSSNPFDCECRLRDFVEWQRDKYIVQPPKCMYPEKLRDKPWNHLKLDEFACAPKLTPGSGGKKAVVNMGHPTSLSCKTSGVPEPKLIWEFHNATQTVVIQAAPGKYELKKSPMEGCQHYEPLQTTFSGGCTWMHILKIVKVGPSDVGVYHCKATNPADTQYLVFQLDLDRGQIVQQVTAGSDHMGQIVKPNVPQDGSSGSVPASEKAAETSSSGDILMISLILGATILVVVALLLAVLCYRRAANKNGRSAHMHGNGGIGGAQTSGSTAYKPKTVNGYGYHIIDNGGAGPTSPTSAVVVVGDASATTSLRSPTSPAVLGGAPGVNPVEKPPRTHVENFYSESPSVSGVCDYHRQQLEQRRQFNQPRLDDSRTGLIHAEGDDSGFSDPETYFYQQQRYATLPYQRNHQPQTQHLAPGQRTPGQRILRPAFDDPLLEKKLLLMRRNSDGGSGTSGCCVGHGHSAVADEQQKRTMEPFMANPYDKAELRETAL